MSSDELERSLERIHEVAQLAGIRGVLDREQGMFRARYQFDDGRELAVLVQPTRMGEDGMLAVTVSCPILQFSEQRPIPDDMAMELLRRNERMFYARYGIRDLEDASLVVASVDHPLETLDAAELEVLMASVIQAAGELMQAVGA